jgi:hypothetical protein
MDANWGNRLKKKLVAVGQLVGGNQTDNQSGGVLGQLGEKAKGILLGQ